MPWHHAHVPMEIRHVAVPRDGLADIIQGDLVPDDLMGKHAEQVHGIGVAWVGIQYPRYNASASPSRPARWWSSARLMGTSLLSG